MKAKLSIKKALSLIVVLVMLLTMIPAGMISVSAAPTIDLSDYDYATEYVIMNVEDWILIATTAQDKDFSGITVKLGADLDFSEYTTPWDDEHVPAEGNFLYPMYNGQYPSSSNDVARLYMATVPTLFNEFAGYFDGDGHTIRNAKFEEGGIAKKTLEGAEVIDDNFENVGVTDFYDYMAFGIVAGEVTGSLWVENVHVIDSNVYMNTVGTIHTGSGAALLGFVSAAAGNEGAYVGISNCTVDADVSCGNYMAWGYGYGTGMAVGTVDSNVDFEMTGCEFSGTLNSIDWFAGVVGAIYAGAEREVTISDIKIDGLTMNSNRGAVTNADNAWGSLIGALSVYDNASVTIDRITVTDTSITTINGQAVGGLIGIIQPMNSPAVIGGLGKSSCGRLYTETIEGTSIEISNIYVDAFLWSNSTTGYGCNAAGLIAQVGEGNANSDENGRIMDGEINISNCYLTGTVISSLYNESSDTWSKSTYGGQGSGGLFVCVSLAETVINVSDVVIDVEFPQEDLYVAPPENLDELLAAFNGDDAAAAAAAKAELEAYSGRTNGAVGKCAGLIAHGGHVRQPATGKYTNTYENFLMCNLNVSDVITTIQGDYHLISWLNRKGGINYNGEYIGRGDSASYAPPLMNDGSVTSVAKVYALMDSDGFYQGYSETICEHMDSLTWTEVSESFHTANCPTCGTVTSSHQFDSFVGFDEEKHTERCVCGYEKTFDHEYTETLVEGPYGSCYEYECACGDTFDDHAWEIIGETKDPTCTEEGFGDYECWICGTTKSGTIPPIPHEPQSYEIIDGTLHKGICSCGYEFENETHSWGSWTVTKKATCTEEGSRQGSCTLCGYVVTEAIAKDLHTKDRIEAVDDTHHRYVCTCGYEWEAQTHNFGSYYWYSSTKHYHRCSTCNHVAYVDHAWRRISVIKSATFNEEGSELWRCLDCNREKTVVVPKLSEDPIYQNLLQKIEALENAQSGTADELSQAIRDLNASIELAKIAAESSDAALNVALLAAIETAKNELNAAIAQVQKNLDDAKTALEAADKKNADDLEAAINNLTAMIDAAKAAAENADTALKNELTAAINAAKSALEAKIAEVQENLDKAIEDLEAADKKNADDLAAAINNLTAMIDAAKAAAENADTALKNELTAAINAAKSALEAKIDEVQENLDKAIEDLEAADKKNADDLAAAITNLNNAIDAAEAAAENDNAALKSELLATIAAAKAELNVAISQVQKNLDDAKTALEAADKKNADDLAQAITDLNAAIEAAKTAALEADAVLKTELLAAIETAKGELSAAIAQVQQNLDDAKAELDAADAKNAADLAQAITDLNAAIDAAEVAAQTADAAIKAELEGAIAAAKTELSAAISAVQKNLDDTKLALEQRITELENQVEIESEKTKMYIIVVGVIGGFGIIASLGIALLSLLKKKN